MAIVFLQEKKTQKNLIFIFGIALIITVFVIWQGFFKKEKTTTLVEETLALPQKEVKINFETFKDPLLEKLQSFTEISPLKETPGRENPFISY
ncbi:MAG: hypothetical protein COS26_00340 [Candidatus Nealsonbacteria bacterium CG02_land_8_20_14_3_00_40_11]|uniref:Uncharacterized protein n=1 Tax=Candidatus Nealsonbacteria bacterium CG02_land_8_20_14_3_00_40_11 TaxID=1974700 RepID=A0A2M7D8N3_9BACT|nr:MAG: hypothetical protein COS26_00340 [Candidatus Nealsonbacteria bacterium CG02_land_8_20_14_3_00_40_11]